MDAAQKAQQNFFQLIRDKLPAHVSLPDEIEEVLGISTDSAYRRIRGEKELSFGELQKLCAHYAVSADMVMNTTMQQEVVFRYRPLNPDTFNLKDYIKLAYETVKAIADQPDARMIYAAKDMPVFHFFLCDEIASFKTFVWQKTLLNFPEFETRDFAIAEADQELLSYGRRFSALYHRFPSIELWNEETINSTLRQIEFYCESNLFRHPEEALLLVDKLEEYLGHIRKQASLGLKFPMGMEPGPDSAELKMYNNEVVLSDNTILAEMGDKKVTFLTHNAINFLTTHNDAFSDTTLEWFNNLARKSSLISTVSEKQRNQFFNNLMARLKKLREKVLYLIASNEGHG